MAKILIVEDDINTRKGLFEILSEEGYSVELAKDAVSALAKMDSEVDLLLTDLRLPGFSGLELYRKAKKVRPGLMAIIMTAYEAEEYNCQAEELEVLAWLTKPLNVDNLLSLTRRALSQTREKQITKQEIAE